VPPGRGRELEDSENVLIGCNENLDWRANLDPEIGRIIGKR
jgi:hypothetical protein